MFIYFSFTYHFCYSLVCSAAVNPITVVYDRGDTTFSTSSQAIVNYIISVNNRVTPSNASLLFQMGESSVNTELTAQQITSGSGSCTSVSTLCGKNFSLKAGESCCLSLTLTSSLPGIYQLRPTVKTIPAIYSAQADASLPITVVRNLIPQLQVSTSQLALSINGTTSTNQAIGKPRVIVLSNPSDVTVSGLSINEPTWPSGTSMSTNCSSELPAQSSCNITITPGTIASASCTDGTIATADVLTVSANDVNSLTVDVVVLGYACIYQEGYLFSIDDSPSSQNSISGTIAALVDQGSSIRGSSNGVDSTSFSYDLIPGIGNTSSTSSGTPTFADFSTYFQDNYTGTLGLTADNFSQCNGKTDGRCNSSNIITFYNYYQTNYGVGTSPYTPTTSATSKSFYAAGICDEYDSGHYQDWYLPAVCELTYGSVTYSVHQPGCGLEGSPLAQNILDNLYHNSNKGHLTEGHYWSSTEFMEFNPETYFWNSFIWSVEPEPGGGDKNDQIPIRCVRALN